VKFLVGLEDDDWDEDAMEVEADSPTFAVGKFVHGTWSDIDWVFAHYGTWNATGSEQTSGKVRVKVLPLDREGDGDPREVIELDVEISVKITRRGGQAE
jgi:hypothetical protein